MLKNYLKIAYRSIVRNRIYSSINIFGLSLGLASFIIIALFVQYEFSYDSFHDESDNIYRIVKKDLNQNLLGISESARTSAPLDDVLKNDFPEVEYATQLTKASSFISHENEVFQENGIFVSHHFLEVFDYKIQLGESNSPLSEPNTIVLTSDLAQKYFGDLNPIGETVSVAHSGSHFDGQKLMEVTAVIENVPANSHIDFDFIVSENSSNELVHYLDNWASNSYLTYVKLNPNADIQIFSENIKYLQDSFLQSENDASSNGYLSPQPLKEIHLKSSLFGEFQSNGNANYVLIFSSLAFIVLIIACINYTNLATARSFIRAKEVGVRKAIGAVRKQLIAQFLSESVIFSATSFFIALALVQLFLPVFNELAGREISLNFQENYLFLVGLFGVSILVGILSGSFPAFKMSTVNTIKVLKGIKSVEGRKSNWRNALVISQFAAACFLIIATITVVQQLNFIQNSNTGLDRDQVISIQVKDRNLYERYHTLKAVLENRSDIVLVSASQNKPIDINSSSPLTSWEGAQEESRISVYRSAIQHDYIDIFDLEIVEGRNFSEDFSSDISEGMIINETLKNQLGWTEAVGKEFNFRGREARITGVVKDFHYSSFRNEIAPLALYLESDWWFPYQHIFVRVSTENIQETLSFLESTWTDFSPDYPFEYQFLDESYNALYQAEIRLSTIINYFTFLAIFLACLGVFGLAAFTASQRKKEIGIRKILGAGISNILTLLAKDYMKPVIIGFLLASPISWILMNIWLKDFVYRIEIGLLPFLAAGLGILLLTVLTVGSQSLKVALSNPADSINSD